MLEFINLFFVPIISVYIFEKKGDASFIPSLKLVMIYIIFTVVNVPITHFIGRIVYRMPGEGINAASAVYTLVALCVAFLLPYVFEIFRLRISISINERGKKHEEEHGEEQEST